MQRILPKSDRDMDTDRDVVCFSLPYAVSSCLINAIPMRRELQPRKAY